LAQTQQAETYPPEGAGCRPDAGRPVRRAAACGEGRKDVLNQGKRNGTAGRSNPRARSKAPTALFLASFALGLGPCGCASFWDDVTSRDFHFKALFAAKPDPFVVLKESNDGDERAKALRALREPKQFGGTDPEQEMVVKLLNTAAANEKQPLCRLAAIKSLGGFKDPRAADGLRDAFYAADQFVPETATVIRCQALTAVGQIGNPAGVELLARVLREPPREGTEAERQQALDVRLAAARALGHFHHYQATEALYTVLRGEKEDVTLRDCAHESLQACTGQNLPADPKAWDEFLHHAKDQQVAENTANKPKLLIWLAGLNGSP
jgi:HEAT repeat protein